MSEGAPRFSPLLPARTPTRVAVALAGPLLWLIGFVILALVTHDTGTILFGVGIAFMSFAISLLVVLSTHRRRIREEEEGPPGAAR